MQTNMYDYNFFKASVEIDIESPDIKLEDGFRLNPFFIDMSYKIEPSGFDRVIIMSSTADDTEHIDTLTKKIINIEDIEKCSNVFTLHIGQISMLKLYEHYSIIVKKDDLAPFDIKNNIELHEMEIVICLFEVNNNDLLAYNNVFTKIYDIEDVRNVILLFNKYNGFDKSTDSIHNITDMIYNIKNIDDHVDINKLLKVTDNKRIRYDLLNMMLMSNKCDAIINNKETYKYVKPMMIKFLPLYSLILKTSWKFMMDKERNLKPEDFLIDINTATEYIDFPFCTCNIQMSPYIACTKTQTYPHQSFGRIKNRSTHKISNLNNFIKKMNIFSTGNESTDLFNGLEKDDDGKWKHFIMTGDAMIACLPEDNPLIDLIDTDLDNTDLDNNLTYKEKYKRFFNEYYHKSTTDLMYTGRSVVDFINAVHKLSSVIKKNLINKHIEVIPNKKLTIHFTKEYIEHEHFDKDINKIINNLSEPHIRNIFYFKYASIKEKMNKNKQNKYNEYVKPTDWDDMGIHYVEDINDNNKKDSEYYIYLNDVKTLSKDNYPIFKVSDNIEYIIRIKDIRDIRVFRCNAHLVKDISLFPLSCLKSYYQGSTVKIFPSCVSSLMTGLNTYYANISDTLNTEVINKYLQRGFATILNENDIETINKYNGSTKKLDINHEFYKPGTSEQEQGFPKNSYNEVHNEYVITLDQVYEEYKSMYGLDIKDLGFDIFKLKKFDSLKPERWIIDAIWNIMK